MSEKRATFSDDCVESSGGKGNTQTTSDGFAQSKLSKSMSQATCDAASSRSARHLTRSPLKDGPGRNSCFGAGRSSRIGSIDSTGGLTPGVATSAAVGATVAGPAAPVGAAIGAAVSTLLRQAAGGTIGMRLARTAATPAGLLKEAWRSVINSPEVLESLPNIGVLRTEHTAYPPALHELTETNSYLYGSLPIVVSGLKYEHALEGGALSETLLETLQGSVASLEAKGVVAISGDSGALIHYQQEVTRMTRLPVALSSLLQAPLIAAVYPPEQKLLVITADAVAFSEARLCAVLLQLGVSEADAARFLLMGCEAIEGFRPGEEGAPIKMSDTAQQLVELVRGAQAAEEGIRGVLIESTMLPAFSDEIRKACGVAVFDSVTLVDLLHKGRTDNPRFGVSFGPTNAAALRIRPADLPVIGIMRIDYSYPPALGDAVHPNSYLYRTPHATVTGLSFAEAQAGAPLTDEMRAAMADSITSLESQPGLMGIAGDCGFLMHYQREVVSLCKRVPCFVSALLQASLLAALYAPEQKILILTANGPALTPSLPQLLRMSGVPAAQAGRFLVAGCEGLDGFDAVALGEEVNVAAVGPLVVDLVTRRLRGDPKIACVLLECTELPPYADAIREATGLLVLDVITLVDYFHSAVSENPYYGINWEGLVSLPTHAAAPQPAPPKETKGAGTPAAAPPPRPDPVVVPGPDLASAEEGRAEQDGDEEGQDEEGRGEEGKFEMCGEACDAESMRAQLATYCFMGLVIVGSIVIIAVVFSGDSST